MINISFDVPQKMMDLAQEKDIKNRPYDLCLECPFCFVTCDGPNEDAMTMVRRVERLNHLAKKRGLTRSDISEKSGLPLATVNSVMSGRTEDPRHSTMQALSKTINGGCWGQYPCHIAAMLMEGELIDTGVNLEMDALRNRLAEAEDKLNQRSYVAESDQRAIVFLKEQIAFLDNQIKVKDRSIRRKEITIIVLFAIITVLVLCVIGVLIADKMMPNVGWLRSMSAM